VREQKLHWNEITYRKKHKGIKRLLNHIWWSLLQKILLKILCISNWGVEYILRDAFSQIEKMKNLVTLSLNTSYLMWGGQKWHGMPPYGSKNRTSPLDLKRCRLSLIPCIKFIH
jgi:hypothetical protein